MDYLNKYILPIIYDNINYIACCSTKSLIYNNNGELLMLERNKEILTKHDLSLITHDPSIKFLMNQKVNIIWRPENHKYYPQEFKDAILYLLLYLKRTQIQNKLKIPKFVIYEIIKLI